MRGASPSVYDGRHYGSRTIGVVQDPAEAASPSMPESALKAVQVDHVVSSSSLGPLIARLVTQRAPALPAPSALLDFEVGVAERAGDSLPLPIQADPSPARPALTFPRIPRPCYSRARRP